MKLEFGNDDHLALAKKGEIPKEAEKAKTEIDWEAGCDNPCEHCEKGDGWYYCKNCNNGSEIKRDLTVFDPEGRLRCKNCKFLIE